LQAESIRQHSLCDYHKVALRAWLRPDAPIEVALQASASDDDLLRGQVPQVLDWLRAWRAARTPQSWEAAAQTAYTEHYIRATASRSVTAETLRAMTDVMARAIRAEKHKWITACSSVSWSFDDRKGFKLMRFRCDALGEPLEGQGTPLAPPQGQAEMPFARGGFAACSETLRAMELSDMAQDYGERTAGEIFRLVREFCLGDDELFAKACRKTTSVVADGALLKTCHLLKVGGLPSIKAVFRDPAHAIRNAIQVLNRTGSFEQHNEMLFTGKDALLKKITHSDLWQAKLESCQRLIVAHDGAQGGGVRTIMRHFAWAPHRWESTTEPRRRFCCSLNAIALLLADVAGDARMPPEQRRGAEHCVDQMTPRFVLDAGLSADFSEECTRFLRRFDVEDRDPATTPRLLRDFRARMTALFVDGRIVSAIPADAPGIPAGAMTATHIALSQFDEILHIRCGDKIKALWSNTGKDQVLDALAQIKSATVDMFERLDADFDENDLYMALGTFDLAEWAANQSTRASPPGDVDPSVQAPPPIARAPPPGADAARARRLALSSKARRLCEALGAPFDDSRDWNAALQCALAHRKTLGCPEDNRRVWAYIARQARFAWLSPVIAFYVSMQDGTGNIERNLGMHANFLAHHVGAAPGDQTVLSSCLELALDGPKTEEDRLAPHVRAPPCAEPPGRFAAFVCRPALSRRPRGTLCGVAPEASRGTLLVVAVAVSALLL
jgi:hypothetical protein